MQLHSSLTRRVRVVVGWRSLAGGVAVLLALAACSGPTAPAVPGPLVVKQRFTLQLSPAQVTLAAGASAHLTATVKRDPGFTDAVTLSLNGAPGGLTATITPTSGSPDVSDVTLQAAASLAPLAYTVTVSGAAGIEQEDTQLVATVVAASTFDVQGRVVDLFREPIANATVSIGGTSATSAADGSFTVAGVSRPYDVVVTLPGKNEVHEFVGLNRTDPVLSLLDQVIAPPFAATVAGTLTGGSPNGTHEVAEMAYASPEAHGGTVLWAGDGPSYGPFTVAWSGPTATTGSLLGLKWTVGPDGSPQQYLGFASQPLDLSDQQSATGADLQLATVATSYLSGTVSPPSGFAVAAKTLWLTAGPMTGMPLGIVAGSDPQFTFATPDAGLPVGVEVKVTMGYASTTLYRANLKPNQVVDMTLPAPPTLGAPGNGTFDHTTVFDWTSVPGAVSVLWLTTSGGPNVYVYTAASSATLPSAPALTLPGSKSYAWTVVGWGMYADMDAFTDPAGGPGSFGLAQDALVATAAPLTVTTSPTP